MYTVYVLKSAKDLNLYVGCTSNIERRFHAHNAGRVRATKSRRPLTLIYSEEFIDKYDAFRSEKYYKTAKGKKDLKNKIRM